MTQQLAAAARSIAPGQIWVIEQRTGAALATTDRDALVKANVVLYARALEPLVAEILPLGSYAEPLPAEATTGMSPRALAFAADGWSVVELVEATSDWQARWRDVPGDLPVHLVNKAADEPAWRVSRAGDLQELADAFADGNDVTVVLGPFAAHAAPWAPAFTANGLAG